MPVTLLRQGLAASLAASTAMALCALQPATARAQAWPAKPIRVVIAFAPAGPADIVARLVAPAVGEALGQPLVIDNRPGAGGNIAAALVAKSAPDGHTLLATSTSIATNPSLLPNPGYDYERDFTAVAIAASTPNILVANPALGTKTLREVFEKARGMKLNYSHAGSGTTPHLSGEYVFKVLGKVDVQAIAYKGGGPAIQAVVAGETQLASMAITTTVAHIKAGRLQGLAVTSAKRQAVLPDVPTMAELGYPEFEDYTWIGLFAPQGTQPAIVNRLNAEIERALRATDVRDKLAGMGMETLGYAPQQANDYVRREIQKWARVVRETGAKGE